MDRCTKIGIAMSKFVDTQYVIDDPSKGWDCLNSIATFYREMGVDFPTEFEGWTFENYGRRALGDPDKAHKAFEKFVLTLGKEIDPNYMKMGDLLLIAVKDFGVYAGIFCGNGNAFFMFDKGGRVVPLSFFRPSLRSVRRLID